MDEMWGIMMNVLSQANGEHRLAIHAFVLMGNHFHLLCHTPNANLDEVMHFILREVSIAVKKQIWDGGYKWSIIGNQSHYYQVYRYIYQNPIRANIVERVEDYKYSTIAKEPPFPLHSFVPMSFAGIEGELIWLNEIFDEEERKLIRLGLRKSRFDVGKKV